VFGYEKMLATQVARVGEAFKAVGSGCLPAGEYVYVARTASGEVVAYGKLTVVRPTPIRIMAGVDHYSFKQFGC
jgi:hypothetical protein